MTGTSDSATVPEQGADGIPQDVWSLLARVRVVPVVVIDDVAVAGPLGRALVDGGLPLAEVTFRTPGAVKAIEVLADDGQVLVGAGTVLAAEQVDQAVRAGARFVVSPGFSRAVVERAHELGVPVLPGVATATEMMSALAAGITTVKFFPAGAFGGVSGLKALAAPFSAVRFVPTGGVSLASLPDYLAVPQVVAVGGTWVAPRDVLAGGRLDEVARRCAEVLTVVATTGTGPEGQGRP